MAARFLKRFRCFTLFVLVLIFIGCSLIDRCSLPRLFSPGCFPAIRITPTGDEHSEHRSYTSWLRNGQQHHNSTSGHRQQYYNLTFGNGQQYYNLNFGNGRQYYNSTFGNGRQYYNFTFGNDQQNYNPTSRNGQQYYNPTSRNSQQYYDPTFGNDQQYYNPTSRNGQQYYNYTFGQGQQYHCNGHLLVSKYAQQLMGGFVSFYHLANITALLNLTSVEPFVTTDDGLAGVPPIENFSDPQFVKLSRFFDLDHLKSAVKSCVNGHLVTFDTFMETASREVVVVKPLVSLGKYKNHFKNGVKAIEVNMSASGYVRNVNKWVEWGVKEKRWNSRPFRVSCVLLLDLRPKHPFPLDQLIIELGNVIHKQVATHGSATILINYWRDIESTKFSSSFFYRIPGFKWTHCYDFETCALSQSVVGAAQQFRESLNETRPVVGVHIRGEQLIRYFKGDYMKCLKDLKKLINSDSVRNLISNGSLYLLHDLGEYGTKSCSYPSCVSASKKFVAGIKNLGYRIVYYDSVEFRPKGLQSAFSALVEMEYLSKMDVLITVGKGQFQNKIIERFMKHKGHDHNLTRICSQGGFELPPPPSKLDHKN